MTHAAPHDSRDENEQHLAAIEAGIAAADAGELIDFEEVEADVRKRLAALLAR
jgi:predicted transcriptional regulator